MIVGLIRIWIKEGRREKKRERERGGEREGQREREGDRERDKQRLNKHELNWELKIPINNKIVFKIEYPLFFIFQRANNRHSYDFTEK